MVTLHILQLLEDEGFGTIDAIENGLYWEKMPLNGKGVGIYSRGTELRRGLRTSQAFDLYSRGTSDLLGADKLEKIKEFFDSTYGTLCDLPVTAKSNKLYTKVKIENTSNVDNLGLDENNRIVFRLSAEVTYSK